MNLRHLDSKMHSFYWRLLILQRLEDFVKDNKETLAEQNIHDLTDLLFAVVSPSQAPLVAVGRMGLPSHSREAMGDLFDEHKHERFRVNRDLENARAEVARLKRQPIHKPTYEGFVQQGQLIEEKREEAILLAQKLEAIPTRNSVDPSLWLYPTETDLVKEKYIKARNKKARYTINRRAMNNLDGINMKQLVKAEGQGQKALQQLRLKFLERAELAQEQVEKQTELEKQRQKMGKPPTETLLKLRAFHNALLLAIREDIDFNVPYPLLTDRGKEIKRLSDQLAGTLQKNIEKDEQLCKETCRQVWSQLQLAMKREGTFRSIVAKIFNE